MWIENKNPPAAGNYFVYIERAAFGCIHARTYKSTCFYSDERGWLIDNSNERVVKWLSESEEPNQNLLWEELVKEATKRSLHSYIHMDAIERLKKLYTLVNK